MSTSSKEWRLDQSTLGVPALIVFMSAVITVVSIAATIQKRVDTLEATTVSLHTEIKETRMTALQVARIEERIDALHQSMRALHEELRTKNYTH